jgi:O-antigen/teichoic acid export membrane protein
MRDLWATIAHTSGAKIYSLLIGLFTISLTARLLGPEGRGQVATITTWVAMFSTITYLSLGQVALHRMADDREHKRFGSLLGSLLLLAVILTMIGWLVALGLYWTNPKGVFKGIEVFPLFVGFLALPFMIWEQYGSSLLMGLEHIRTYNRYQVIGRTVSVVTVFILVGSLGFGVTGVMESNLLGEIIIAMGGIGFLFAFARSKGLTCRPNKAEIKALLSGALKLHFNAIGTFLFTSANILILNHYHGPEQTGYFQLVTQLLGVFMIIPQAATMVIYGKVAKIGVNAAWKDNKRLLIQINLGMIVLIVIAALISPWGIVLLAGESFKPAVEPFQWMLLGLIGMTFSTVMAPQWIGRGYFWQAAALTLLLGIINFVANLWLIPQFGIKGAVYAFLGTYVFSILSNGGMVIHCNRMIRELNNESH